MGARFFRPKRLLTLALLGVSIAVGVWWAGHVPYDPMAIYRPIPGSASLVGRHLALPARWAELLANPLARVAMRALQMEPEYLSGLAEDEESRDWFEKLAGREGTLAYLPGRRGGPPAWIAVSHLGGQSQKLRWQLALFNLPGFTRMEQFPGRSVWRVDTPDLDPGQRLSIAFGEGILMACLSANPLAIAEILAAYDGNVRRLLEEEPSFAQFAAEDDRRVPDRLWFRDPSDPAAFSASGITVDIPVLQGRGVELTATSTGVDWVPEDRPAASAIGELARLLGGAPCAAALVRRALLLQALMQLDLDPTARHVLRMVLDVAANDRLALVVMDGELGGRLAWGWIRRLGLAGFRVPTLLVAAPVADPAEAERAIQRVLDVNNARYRAAFTLRPVPVPPATIYVLESAGGDEWVDELSPSDRPAYVVLHGWLLASSNLAALQKLAQTAAEEREAAETPAWAAAVDGSAGAAAWLDLARSHRVAKDAVAYARLAQSIPNSGVTRSSRQRLEEATAWVNALADIAGSAQAALGRQGGRTALSMDLGLFPATGPDKMALP